MDFEYSARTKEFQGRLTAFMDAHVYDGERDYFAAVEASGDPHHEPPLLKALQDRARGEGLWNLFMPGARHGPGLTTLEYAPLCEIMGRSRIAPRVFNCAAPDTGNMEILAEFGTAEQQERWLRPLLDAEIHSCFSMTEPEVAGSDPTLLRCRAERVDGEYVIDGHKWFTTGARGAAFAIVMAVTDPEGAKHRRASQIIVPCDTPGFKLVRLLPYMGPPEGTGHGEIVYDDCRVPVENLLGEEHAGFAIAQARLGPGRIHHCMRSIGQAELALEMMCRRTSARFAHGSALSEKGVVQEWIATSRMEIDQARLLMLRAAWKMDRLGKREARQDVSMIKVVAANVLLNVVDRSIQAHGALGTLDDTPLAWLYRYGRSMRLADGPDEVHKMVVARRELRRHAR